VLGRVIEAISGQSLFQFEKRRLLDPLGMRDTAFYVADEAKRPLIAEPMPEDRSISPSTGIRDPMMPRKWESGGAGMVGTVGDYARFAQMLLNGGTFEGKRYLKSETIALMTTDHIGPDTRIARDGFYYPGASSGFGLGFAVRTSTPPNTSWPLGEYRWAGVAGTFFFIDRMDDMFVVFMAQTPSQRGRIQLALKTLIYEATGGDVPDIRACRDHDPERPSRSKRSRFTSWRPRSGSTHPLRSHAPGRPFLRSSRQ
jgi:CubicO group peptidase (beta-lactamase class C family)